MRIGISVNCRKCQRRKAPRGRSIPDVMYGSYCTSEGCVDYWSDPKPGDLFSGETEKDFGYPVSANATREAEA